MTATTETIPASRAPFVPARLLAGKHAQTIFAALLRFTRGPEARRERLELADGDFLDVDVATSPEPLPGSPWALVLHGLEGSSEATYVRGAARALLARGVEVCLLNYRGCSGEPNRLARSFHMGESGDVREAIALLSKKREGKRFAIVGFSSGANILMKLLGEDGERAPALLAGAVGVSPPYELASCCAHMDSQALYVYRERLLRTLRKKAIAKIERFPGIASAGEVRAARTFAAFDEAFTARLHGFKDAADYWERSSGIRYAGGIAKDLLIVSSRDDPFFPEDHVPEAQLRANPRIELALTDRGGHVAFVSGSPLRPRYWAEELAADFLVTHLSSPGHPTYSSIE